MRKYNVSAYLNGHDHCAQFIDTKDGIQYHTIGSAHENNPSEAHKSKIPADSLIWHTGKGDGGFASVSVNDEGPTNEGIVVTHRDGDGKILYVAPVIRPRTVSPTLV